ncbi:MAG: hypothetical protein DRP51_02855 [Candidatus Zixiibacteriota bacterium]|nr:MAG: hypothetical protein DRP51_02855 [candidate division Zixibacteria bacterium]
MAAAAMPFRLGRKIAAIVSAPQISSEDCRTATINKQITISLIADLIFGSAVFVKIKKSGPADPDFPNIVVINKLI